MALVPLNSAVAAVPVSELAIRRPLSLTVPPAEIRAGPPVVSVPVMARLAALVSVSAAGAVTGPNTVRLVPSAITTLPVALTGPRLAIALVVLGRVIDVPVASSVVTLSAPPLGCVMLLPLITSSVGTFARLYWLIVIGPAFGAPIASVSAVIGAAANPLSMVIGVPGVNGASATVPPGAASDEPDP